MTVHAHETPAAQRVGLTNLETAEKRRRIAEIAWEVAQARDKVPGIEAALERPEVQAKPRKVADLKLEIGQVAFDIAKLRHESALLKADLAEDKANFPR